MPYFKKFNNFYQQNKSFILKTIHHKNKDKLIGAVGEEGDIILNALINQVKLKTNNPPKDGRKFFPNIPFSIKRGKELTNLSDDAQKRGLRALEEMKVISVEYVYSDWLLATSRIVWVNFWNFEKFYNSFIKIKIHN